MKNHMLPFIAIAASALVAVVFAEAARAQQTSPPPDPATARGGEADVVALAVGDANLATLVSALRAADLVGVLSGRGPFTVFAPNNAAFAKLPPGALDDLLKPENKNKLAAILRNHVVKGRVMASDVKPGGTKTLNGHKVELAKTDGKITYGGAAILVADMEAGNGVVHVIDTVVMPD